MTNKKFSENLVKLLDKYVNIWYNTDTKKKGYRVWKMREFIIKISEESYNTVLTALRYEKSRAESEGNKNNVDCLERAIKDVYKNASIALVK